MRQIGGRPVSNSLDPATQSASELVDALLNDQCRRWRQGTPVAVEDYLAQHPTLTADAEGVLALIYNEIECREQAGDPPQPEEYQRRFPRWATEIAAQFEVHRALKETNWELSAQGVATPEGSSGPALPTLDEDSAAPEETQGGGAHDAEGEGEGGPAPAGLPATIGRYRVQRSLGEGVFGAVYLAIDGRLNRPVAVKVPRLNRFPTRENAARFLAEARLAAGLRHEAIVNVHDFVEQDDGTCYIVMEYIEGESLNTRFGAGRLDPTRAAALVAQLADAVHHAHTHGVVHGDLKPANILIDRRDRPHIADFGLAVHEADQRRLAGQVTGTPLYMAPEQVRGEAHYLDGRTDIWSLGVILYELLTGRCPFSGTSLKELFDEVLKREPKPPRQIVDTIPRGLEQVCLKCLAKRIADRYTTAADLASDLRGYAGPPGVGPGTAPPLTVVPRRGAGVGAGGAMPPTRPSSPTRGGQAASPAPSSESESGSGSGAGAGSGAERGRGDVAPSSGTPPDGGLAPDDASYVRRPSDDVFAAALARRDSVVLVRGPRQAGKTSLLARGIRQAREAGARVVFSDFQRLNRAELETPEAFYLALGNRISRYLRLDVRPEQVWDPGLAPNFNFEEYVQGYVIEADESPLLWALDEVDRLFTCPFGGEVFGLLRSWHNARSVDPSGPWSNLTLAISYASEAHLFIKDLNQSPFNIGTLVPLVDFNPEQVAELNRRRGAPLRDGRDLGRFYDLLGGHPHLSNRGLYEMARQGLDFDAFHGLATHDEGLFSTHLRRTLVTINQDRELLEATRCVLGGRPCPSLESFYRLRAAGILAGDSAREARPRCRLLAIYLQRHLQ